MVIVLLLLIMRMLVLANSLGFYRSWAPLRFLTRRLVLLAFLAPVTLPVFGLGLGALQHQSQLGEPLAATINIIADKDEIDLDQIHTKQLSAQQAQRLGVELVSTFQRLRLSPQRQNDQLIIMVSSDGDIKEPFINLMVELSWPDGRVYREYTLLLDPPSLTAAVATPADRPSLPARKVKTRALADIASTSGDYRVQPGDSLSKIAQRLTRSTGLPRQQLMASLLAKNPQAFINGDKNRIKAGALLSLPQGKGLSADPQSQQPAAAAAFVAPAPVPKAVEAPAGAPASSIDEKTRLTLTTERQDAQRLLARRSDELSVSQLQSRLDAVNELNERLMRDSREMQERLRLVEGSSYMQNLEELLALKEKQVAELKKQLGQSGSSRQQARVTKQGSDEQFDREQSTDNSQRINSATAAELSKVEPVVAKKRSYLWLWLLIILSFIGLAIFYWLGRSKDNTEHGSAQPTNESFNEILTLDELDQLMAKQGDEARPIPLQPEHPKDEYTQPSSVTKAKPPKKAQAPKPAIKAPDSSKPSREGWRADDDVLSGIQQKMQSYIPPVYEDDSGVEHHDEMEDLITEALSYGKKGYYDTAEALLQAEKARNGGSQRIDEAIEFLQKKKNSN